MKIVLDTNIILADFRLSGNAFRVFFEGIQRTGTKVYIPQVVIDEVIANFKERIDSLVNKIDRLKRTAKRLTDSFDENLSIHQLPHEIVSDYRKVFLQQIEEAGIIILPYPELAHQKVVQRDLLRRKPFKENGAGYRDTLIWETILSLLQEQKGQILFVTRNSKDFGEGPDVLPELLQDINELGFGNKNVRLYNSLDTLNNELFIPQLKRLDKMMLMFENDEVSQFSLTAWIQENILEQLKDGEWDYSLAELEPGHGSTKIETLNIKSTIIDDVRALPSGNLLLSATVKVEGNVDVEIDWEDYINYKDVQELIDDIDESERFKWLTTTVPFDSTIEFTLILEDESYRPLSFEVDELHTYKYGIVVNKHPRKPPNPVSS